MVRSRSVGEDKSKDAMREFAHLEEGYGKGERNSALQQRYAFFSRKRDPSPTEENGARNHNVENRLSASLSTTLGSSPNSQHKGSNYMNGMSQMTYNPRSFLKSAVHLNTLA